MVKSLLVLAAVCIAVAAGIVDKETSNGEFILKQKKVLNLFYHVTQPDIVNPDQYKTGLIWNIRNKIDMYNNKDAVEEFLHLYEHGMLPRGDMFSVYYPVLLKESAALFRVLYHASDFDTFFNTALWAKIHVNEGVYLCALYQAVLLRADTEYIKLPPPYEFYPYAFFNSEVMDKAKNAHLYREIQKNPDRLTHDTVVINANYSGWYIDHDDHTMESKINYFTEDIGLNTYYFYLRQVAPFWLHSDLYNFNRNIRGKEYLYGHKLLLTRYNLERFANGLEHIEHLDWHSEFPVGYYPSMTYHNGLPFPQRPHWTKIPHYKYIYSQAIQEFESRITAAIDLGYVFDKDGNHVKIYTPEGLNILGNIIEGNEDSVNKNYYGSLDAFGRKILGFNVEPKTDHQIVPSALETFASCLRDPAFYRLYDRITHFYLHYQSHLPKYTKEEIIFPDVKIETVTVDKLMTYFDDFDTTITNGLLVANQKEADTFLVKVRQQRLNHKPFNVHIGIHSEKSTKAAIQLFLGPKYDVQGNLLDFTHNYKNFYEIDYWVTDLTSGANKIERNCHDFFFTYDDQLPTEVLYKTVEKALETGGAFKYQERIYGFPQRLLLPKGSVAGTPFQLFVYVYPFDVEGELYKSRIWGEYEFGPRSFGFPLDRPIHYPNFIGPNVYFKDVTIYHKDGYDINATV